MALLIFWSDEAVRSYEKNLRYLEDNWTDREISIFIKRTASIIQRISEYPEMYMRSPKSRSIRRAVINRYIVLFYKYHKTGKVVELVTFWHQKQNPGKLKL